MYKFELERYAECVNVSNIILRKWSNAVTLTPMKIPLFLRTIGNRNNITLVINPKIPPNAKYNRMGCGVFEH